MLKQHNIDFVAVKNLERKLFTRNLFNGIYYLATQKDSVIIEVDGDDYLEDTDVLGVLKKEYDKGARKTFGSFRMAPGSKSLSGLESTKDQKLVTDLTNPWNLDFCYPWMHLKTYRRELFLQVPLVYFWERSRNDWLKTAEDLSSHPMMISIAGEAVHYIEDILYVYDFSGQFHELNQQDRPRYIIENLYRVPAGKFIGEFWEQTRKEDAEKTRIISSSEKLRIVDKHLILS